MVTSCISLSALTMASLLPEAGSRNNIVFNPSPDTVTLLFILSVVGKVWMPAFRNTGLPVPEAASIAACIDSPGDTTNAFTGVLNVLAAPAPATYPILETCSVDGLTLGLFPARTAVSTERDARGRMESAAL